MAQTKIDAFANISASTTDGPLISAVASKAIRIVQFQMVAGATATNVTFNTKPTGAGSAISPLYANGANGGAIANYNPEGWFTTTPGQGLTATTGSGSTVGILVGYVTI